MSVKCKCGSNRFQLLFYSPIGAGLICLQCRVRHNIMGAPPYPLEVEILPSGLGELKIDSSTLVTAYSTLLKEFEVLREKVEKLEVKE